MTASATSPHIGLVVEGPGDRNALPVLLRKHLHGEGEYRDVLGKPVATNGRDKALKVNGIEGFALAAALRPGCVGVLVVLDGEGDCVADLGPSLLERVGNAVGKPVRIALADCDFESWLFASAETLDLELVFSEDIVGQGAIKEALKPAKYVKPTWQPRLTHRMEIGRAAQRSDSLRRMLARFDELRPFLPPLAQSGSPELTRPGEDQ